MCSTLVRTSASPSVTRTFHYILCGIRLHEPSSTSDIKWKSQGRIFSVFQTLLVELWPVLKTFYIFSRKKNWLKKKLTWHFSSFTSFNLSLRLKTVQNHAYKWFICIYILCTKILPKNDCNLHLYFQYHYWINSSTLQCPFKHSGMSMSIKIDEYYRKVLESGWICIQLLA